MISTRYSVNFARCGRKLASALFSTEAQTETFEGNSNGTNVVPVFHHALQYESRAAVVDEHGIYTYKDLFIRSHKFSEQITQYLEGSKNERVAFLCPNNASYVIAQWACWKSGQLAVPLHPSHPLPLLEYYVKDSQAELVVTTREYAKLVSKLVLNVKSKLLILDDLLVQKPHKPQYADIKLESLTNDLNSEFYNTSEALIVYTSGTTGSPKGAVISHRALQSQVTTLLRAWGWTKNDGILHVLPLHHIHGIINALACPLSAGACCVMLPKFDAAKVWNELLTNDRVNLFMAVPTIYAKLIEEYDKSLVKKADEIKSICSKKIRLMVSGSAPLPGPLCERWEEITGHRLLERYGMTETGMVLSHPLVGERRLGFVGTPLPGVEVQIVGSEDDVLVEGNSSGSTVKSEDQTSGNLYVKGPSLFSKYWNKPEATVKEFTPDGWFKTGDTARYDDGCYQIMGRTSVDIIKTGGYKVSALYVETQLLDHPGIKECAIVGIPDETWGQKVAAVVVPSANCELNLSEIRDWSKERLASYASPSMLKVVTDIPKNAMGKVNKKQLFKELFPEFNN